MKAVKIAEEDLLTAHIVPNVKNKYYKVPELLQKEINKGEFKALVDAPKLKSIIEQSKANRM